MEKLLRKQPDASARSKVKKLKLMPLALPPKSYHSFVHPTTDCCEGGTGKNAKVGKNA